MAEDQEHIEHQEARLSERATLYEKSLNSYALSLSYKISALESVQQLRYLPPGVLVDVYVEMSKHKFLADMLFEQLADLETFERLLRFDPARQRLFRCMSALFNNKKLLANRLQTTFNGRYAYVRKNKQQTAQKHPKPPTKSKTTEKQTKTNLIEIILNEPDDAPYLSPDVVDFGLRLGSFLSEAGWLAESIKVLSCVSIQLQRIVNNPEHESLVVLLDCLQRLLHSEQALGNIKAAENTFVIINNMLKKVPPKNIPKPLLAITFTQFSAMYFARSQYDDSHRWSVVAIRHIDDTTPERIAVDVLRQAGKACVVKRDFHRANFLLCQASKRAGEMFGQKHQKYADALLDYGFFLLNVDAVYLSVEIYQEALNIKRAIFGNRNYHVAIAHEDLSYAYYVHEYSTGNFDFARENVEIAINIMQEIVPNDHLKLASAKRVKALLLEEIALDKIADGINEDALLRESEELHKFALNLSLKIFGETNVQTAKHYGNLGRLYQTMKRYKEAENMHLKAIKIKTDILGPQDYEVGLSIGHLASLYNYQMKKYREAERLYLRSIDISVRLFGRGYSGLEYDYLGLCHVYETLHEFEKYLNFAAQLESWQAIRSQNVADNGNNSNYPRDLEDTSLDDVKDRFFNFSATKIDSNLPF